MSHTATLCTLVQAPDLLVMPGIFDGFSARLVEQTGFPAGFISGAGLIGEFLSQPMRPEETGLFQNGVALQDTPAYYSFVNLGLWEDVSSSSSRRV